MGKVICGLSISLDGFIAGKHDDVTEVFAWFGKGWEHFNQVIGGGLTDSGVVIMGHRSFDMIYSEDGWVFPNGFSAPWPVIVLQSQERAPEKKGNTQFHFVTSGIEAAIAMGREIAGEKNIALHGASPVQQALKAQLLDEIHLNVAHVLLGEGIRLFDHIGDKPIHLKRVRNFETPDATHLSFRVLYS